MNKNISKLQSLLEENEQSGEVIKEKLQLAYNEVFKEVVSLNEALDKLSNSHKFSWDNCGEIVQWTRYNGLSDFADCREYFETYLSEFHFTNVDWKNDCLTQSIGPDYISVQDDTRGDNGVWCNGKRVIDETEYKDDGGEVDETKRNQLIEAYMEKTGCFPGVFRTDSHGNIFPVNTKA